MSQHEIQVENFLDTICAQIRCKKAHDSLRKELADHIADQTEHNVASGQDEETAAKEAILSMGDPVVVGGQLDSVHRPKPKWSVILIAVLFLFLGAAMRTGTDELNITFTQWISLFPMEVLKVLPFGIVALACGYFLDYTKLAKYVVWIYPVVCVIILLTLSTSPHINGRIVNVNYLMLLFVPLYATVIYRFKGKGYLGLLLCGICFAPIMIFASLIPHIPLLVLIAAVCLTVLTVAILKGWFLIRKWVGLLIIYTPVALVCLFPIIFYPPSFVSRFFGRLFQTGSNEYFWNYLTRSLLNESEFVGKGNIDTFDLFSLPNAFSSFNHDRRITMLITDFGFLAGILIALITGVFLFFLFRNVLKTQNQLGLFVSLSITLLFAVQAFTYFCANFGLIFFSQYELPLLADGKVNTVIHLFLLGIVLSVFKYQDILKSEEVSEITPAKKWIVKTEEGILFRWKKQTETK